MTKKKTKATRKRGERTVKVEELPKAEKQLSEDELKAVEGAGPLASFTHGFVSALEDTAAGIAHVVGQVAKDVERGIKGE